MERLGPVIVWVVRVAYSFSVGGAYYGGYPERGVSSEPAGAEYAGGDSWEKNSQFGIDLETRSSR